MARASANLQVAAEIREAVSAAVRALSSSSNSAAHVLQLGVDAAAAKVSLLRTLEVPMPEGASDSGDSVSAAFAALHEECTKAAESGSVTKARLFAVLLRTSAHGSPVGEAATSEWLLISFVPDLTHPKTKMTFAAARDDIRRAVDDLRGATAYHVTELKEVDAKVFTEWRDRSDRESAMSNWELRKAAVVRETEIARSSGPEKLMGMGAVPFKLSDGVISVLQQLSGGSAPAATPAPAPAADTSESTETGDAAAPPSDEPASSTDATEASTSAPVASPSKPPAAAREASLSTPTRPAPSVSLVELAVTGETVAVVSSESGEARDVAYVVDRIMTSAGKEPRYFALRVASAQPSPAAAADAPKSPAALVYYCPEDSAPRSRMKYSTAKAALLDGASNAGITFDRVVEAHDKDDLTHALSQVASGADAGLKSPSARLGAASPTLRSPMAGGFALPGMGSPRLGTSMSSDSAVGGVDTTFDKPARPGRAGTRPPGAMALPGMGGIALPGMGSPK